MALAQDLEDGTAALDGRASSAVSSASAGSTVFIP